MQEQEHEQRQEQQQVMENEPFCRLPCRCWVFARAARVRLRRAAEADSRAPPAADVDVAAPLLLAC